jgi:hypothetical protein
VPAEERRKWRISQASSWTNRSAASRACPAVFAADANFSLLVNRYLGTMTAENGLNV